MQTVRLTFPCMGKHWRGVTMAALVMISLNLAVFAQSDAVQAGVARLNTAAVPVVPQQVRYGGTVAGRTGDTVEAVFRIYAAQQGGDSLWTETQQVTVDATGQYNVLLGSVTEGGLPETVFAAGEARWLGVSIEGGEELPRTQLVSVAYAMKAGDAETVGGLPASSLVTQQQLAAAEKTVTAQPGLTLQPEISSPTGTGTTNYVPLWTGTSTLGNSNLYQAASGNIGIGNTTPGTLFDVGSAVLGTITGNVISVSNSTAKSTVALGQDANDRGRMSWIYNATPANAYLAVGDAHGTHPMELQDQGGSVGIGTPTPGALLEVAGTAKFDGNITFASTQTFPITGTGGGTITGITTTSPLTGSGTSGSVALGLNISALESTLSGTYARLGAINTFSANQVIDGELGVYGQVGVYGTNEGGPMFTVSNSGDAASSAITASNGGNYGTGIAASAGAGGFGVLSTGVQSAGSAAILGYLNGGGGLSGSYSLLESDDGLDAGVWADAPTGTTSGVIATADNAYAGIFYNDSSIFPTITALNNNSGGSTGLVASGIANALRAGGPGGICGISQSGSIACTGQVKSLLTTRDGTRQIETYSVQSAENWVEDYGSGQLNHGVATIPIEAAFGQIVSADAEYHVLLTPGGDCKGLYVTNKTATGFEVHELGGGTSSIPFDYKIAVKRTGMENQRLVDVTARMKLETEAVRFKPLAHPLPSNRSGRPTHTVVTGDTAPPVARNPLTTN